MAEDKGRHSDPARDPAARLTTSPSPPSHSATPSPPAAAARRCPLRRARATASGRHTRVRGPRQDARGRRRGRRGARRPAVGTGGSGSRRDGCSCNHGDWFGGRSGARRGSAGAGAGCRWPRSPGRPSVGGGRHYRGRGYCRCSGAARCRSGGDGGSGGAGASDRRPVRCCCARAPIVGHRCAGAAAAIELQHRRADCTGPDTGRAIASIDGHASAADVCDRGVDATAGARVRRR